MEIEKLKQVITELPEEEAKSLLFHFLLNVQLLSEKQYSEAEFITKVKEMSKMVFELSDKRKVIEDKHTYKMIHILFGASPAGSLKVALKELGVNHEEAVISFWDIFSVGPIWQLHKKSGMEERFAWKKNSMNDEFDELDEYMKGFRKTVDQIEKIPEDVPVTIWVANNAHEQTGLRFALYLLKNKAHNIKVINCANIFVQQFYQPNIEFFPLHAGEISPEKLKVIFEQGKKQPLLSQLEKEQYVQEWLQLSTHQETLRIWEDGKVRFVSEDYFDELLISTAQYLHSQQEVKDFMKSARLIGEVLGHIEQYVGDEFLEYRVRKLIEKGIFDVEGSLEAMRYYSVKLK
ncbi:DUF1835 domain-containing protein [Bacillus sp. Bva_UNVM-123]|uniref:DUF1835 domain-containing protein n=1 Tax=Bacillus sp. Bva_UNVM-123 TaxID=2829798 RepID=UPI00391F3CC0